MLIRLLPQDNSSAELVADLRKDSQATFGGAECTVPLQRAQNSQEVWFIIERNNGAYSITCERDDILVNDTPCGGTIELHDGDIIQIQEDIFSLAIEAREESSHEVETAEENTSETIEHKDSEDSEQDFTDKQEPEEKEEPITHQELEEKDDDIFAASTASSYDHKLEESPQVDLETSHWLFKVLTGPNSGAQMSLEDGKDYIIGSDANSCDIVLTDLSVSKQHLKLKTDEDGKIFIEDLNSRNGVLLNGEKIEKNIEQDTSAIITAGATTFMVVDRHKEQKTIVTPNLPIKERVVVEKVVEKSAQDNLEESSTQKHKEGPVTKSRAKAQVSSSAIFIAFMLAIVGVLSFGVYSLFDEQQLIKSSSPDHIQELTAILEEYPYFDFQFNEGSGNLQLSGHILTQKDKNLLLNRLQSLSFIRHVDTTNLIVDDLVWQQFNLSLERNFKGITLSGQIPGEFIISGVLQTQGQSEELNRYLTVNFPYNDLLVNKVVVEEQVVASINDRLQEISPNELIAELNNGELLIVGTIPPKGRTSLQELIAQVKTLPGISNVRNLVIEQSKNDDNGMIDISNNYEVSGFTKEANANVNIIINGRILKRGDVLDGMTIVSIRPKMVILEKDNIKYRINYNP